MKRYRQIIIMEPGHVEFRDDPLDLLEDTYARIKPLSIPLEPDEVAGNTLYSLLSVGTEMNFYLGNYINSPVVAKYPRHCGYACSFRVEAVGSDVTDVKPGDICYCRGPHATIQRVRRRDLVKLPEGMDPRRAPFTKFMCVGMTTLTDSYAKPPAKVMVSGLGIIGVMAAQVFQRCGYNVIGVDPSQARRELARQCGITKVFAQPPLDDPEYGGQISLALECSSVESGAMGCARMVRRFGEVVLVATHLVRTEDRQMNELLNVIYRNNVTFKGGVEWKIPVYEPDFSASKNTAQLGNDVPAVYHAPYSIQNSYEMNMKAAVQWLAEGSILVDHLYDLHDPRNCTQIYKDVSEKKNIKPALMFDWSQVD
ncbi:MAG: zinc-binding alcohol dehydrogenase [Oscillospiraceae bacterium]